MYRFYYLFLYLFLSSFFASSQNATPFFALKSRSLDTINFYNTNPLTGDTLERPLLPDGSYVNSGKTINISELKHNIVTRGKLHKVETGNADEQKFIQNKFKVGDLPGLKIDKSKIRTANLPNKNTWEKSLTVYGKSIPTGKKIPLKGKKVAAKKASKTAALQPRYKDAASADIQYLNVEQGLNYSYITTLYQDKKGNLWMGTFGDGVTMYDGISFYNWSKHEGLSGNKIQKIVRDKKGDFWFATDYGGLTKYNGYEFTHYTIRGGLITNRLSDIIIDRENNIWLANNKGGVSKIIGDSIIHYTTNEGLPDNTAWSLIETHDGAVWAGTTEGLCRFKNNKVDIYTIECGLPDNTIISFEEDTDNNLWMGTYGSGALKMDRDSIWFLNEKQNLPANIVWSILEDTSKNIWLSTYGKGIVCYDKKTLTIYDKTEGLTNNIIWSMLEDQAGNIWLGTDGGGICRLKPNSFFYLTEREGMPDNVVLSMCQDKAGDLWLGTYRKGVVKYSGKKFKVYGTKQGLSDNVIISSYADSKGNLWFGTYGGGVNKFDSTYFTVLDRSSGLSGNNIRSIIEDEKGNLLFGTDRNGLTVFNGQKFEHIDEKTGLWDFSIRTMVKDTNGNIWMALKGAGVCKYNGKSLLQYTVKEGLSDNFVISLAVDDNNNIWMGTQNSGAMVFDGKTFIYITEQNSKLSNNTVHSILIHNNQLWMATESGITAISDISRLDFGKEEPLSWLDIFAFKKLDGLKVLDFFDNCALVDKQNNAWWGGNDDLTMLDLDRNNLKRHKPTMQIVDVSFNGLNINYLNMPDSLKKNIKFSETTPIWNYPIKPILSHKYNYLTFYFSGLDWKAPHKLKYSYQIEGFDNDWSELTKASSVEYRNLPPGEYTFKVRAIGESPVWSKQPRYSFVIEKPWWFSWWAISSYFTLVFVLIISYVRLRTQMLKRQKAHLIKEIRKATQEINRQHDLVTVKNLELEAALEELKATQQHLVQSEKMASLGTLISGIAHEINNPLNYIACGAHLIEDIKQEIEQSYKIERKSELDFSIKSIKEGLERASLIVKSLNTFAYQGKSRIKEHDLNEILDSTLLFLHSKISTSVKIEKDFRLNQKVPVYSEKIHQVFLNIIDNAIYAAQQQTEKKISIKTSKVSGMAQVEVYNQGNPIPEELKTKIFDPFFTTKNPGEGTGLGLSICYSIIKEHGGSITVKNQPQGVSFIILIPVNSVK